MVEVHVAAGVILLVLNLLAGAVGGIAWLREQPSIPFWYLLRAAQTSVFAQAMIGSLLIFTGREAQDGLHYLYGVLPLLVSLLAEAVRAGAAQQEIGDLDFDSLPAGRQREIALTIVRREMGVMAMSCIVIVFLALRAAEVSPRV